MGARGLLGDTSGQGVEPPMAGAPTEWAVRGKSIERRLVQINRRLIELRQARPAAPFRGVTEELLAAEWHARDADRHWQESAAHALRVRKTVVEVLYSAARAHDHAAEANERSVRAGVGDVDRHRRMAEFHRTAAEADRQRAVEFERQHADLAPGQDGDLLAR